MTNPVHPMLQAAAAYLQLGLSIIPLCSTDQKGRCRFHGSDCHSPGKTPLLRWSKYQTQRPTIDKAKTWWKRWPMANIGIITGAISNLVVIDIDRDAAKQHVEDRGPSDTVTALTGKGYHLYFQYPGKAMPNAINLLDGLDIRGDGGYVVAPPSVHLSGQRYRWENVRSRSDWHLSPLPKWLQDTLVPECDAAPTKQATTRTHWFIRSFQSGSEKGTRNDTCAKMAGYLLRYLPNPNVVHAILQEWNQKNHPPLRAEEVRKTVYSIWKTARRKKTMRRTG